jgi:hypothetical protein
MAWSKVFQAQDYDQPTFKHKKLPIYITKEFDFFRCVGFKDDFYGKTASKLFNGNLRLCTGRYSCLFPNQKITYWADSPATARAEIKKHGSGCDILTFWAYDDASSFIPCLGNDEYLIIVDGRKCGIQEVIEKIDKGEHLDNHESSLMTDIFQERFDAIAYDSKAFPGGENFIFLESGFKKLALRELRLRFGRKRGGAHNYIYCAGTSDYTPWLKGYGEYFAPKCKIKLDESYLESDEYKTRLSNEDKVWEAIRKKEEKITHLNTQ